MEFAIQTCEISFDLSKGIAKNACGLLFNLILFDRDWNLFVAMNIPYALFTCYIAFYCLEQNVIG